MAVFTNNSDNPNAPEFGKKWKEENNAGCCSCHVPESPPACKTVVQRLTRGDQSEDLISEKDCECPAPIAASDPCPDETGC